MKTTTSLDKRFCECGCGQASKFHNGRQNRFLLGHNNRTIETKKKISNALTGSANGMWKGNNVGINSLHRWVGLRLVKPELCQMCDKVPPYDLACVTNIYSRDLSNWQWLCRKCHMESDDRLIKLQQCRGMFGKKHSDIIKKRISQFASQRKRDSNGLFQSIKS